MSVMRYAQRASWGHDFQDTTRLPILTSGNGRCENISSDIACVSQAPRPPYYWNVHARKNGELSPSSRRAALCGVHLRGKRPRLHLMRADAIEVRRDYDETPNARFPLNTARVSLLSCVLVSFICSLLSLESSQPQWLPSSPFKSCFPAHQACSPKQSPRAPLHIPSLVFPLVLLS